MLFLEDPRPNPGRDSDRNKHAIAPQVAIIPIQSDVIGLHKGGCLGSEPVRQSTFAWSSGVAFDAGRLKEAVSLAADAKGFQSALVWKGNEKESVRGSTF